MRELDFDLFSRTQAVHIGVKRQEHVTKATLPPGGLLKTFRLTQKELAGMIYCSRGLLGHMETGFRRVDPDRLERIIDVFADLNTPAYIQKALYTHLFENGRTFPKGGIQTCVSPSIL